MNGKKKRQVITPALALYAFFFISNALAQGSWQVVHGKGYVVEMPGRPEYDAKEEQMLLDRGRTAYIVQITALPNVSDQRRVLQGGLDGSAGSLSEKKWATVNWIQWQGLMAVEAVGKYTNELIMREMLVLDGRRLFAVIYAGPVNTERSPDADRFFQSFRLTR